MGDFPPAGGMRIFFIMREKFLHPSLELCAIVRDTRIVGWEATPTFFNNMGDIAMAKIAKKVFVLNAGVPAAVRFEWDDGEPATVISLDDVEAMAPWFLANGISQKFGDAYSGAKSPAEARAALQALRVQVLDQGVWAQKGGGGGQVSILAEALHRVMSDNPATAGNVPTMEAIAEKLGKMTAMEVKAMKAKWPSIDVEMQKIRLERSEAKAARTGDEGDDATDLGDLFV